MRRHQTPCQRSGDAEGNRIIILGRSGLMPYGYISLNSASLSLSVISIAPRDSLTIPSFWK